MWKIIFLYTKKLLGCLVEIVFPEFCVGCSKFGRLLCYSCYETIEFIQFSTLPKDTHTHLDSITCCCYYQGITKKIIHEFKYQSVKAIGKTIAHILYYSTKPPNFDIITFVPMYKKKMQQRGFNQAQVIAEELGLLFQKPVVQLLIKTKQTKSQMSLHNKSNRQKNIENTIEINQKISKNIADFFPNVLLIDDVFTSGTTLNYCASVLKKFGFSKTHGFCFAHEE
ncbi:MAG: phosphoribosyl transferase [Patescibacteria group bacterium]|nr:MAG: phosphoribosyl transferase [Patescibacteria group bacterium]